MLYSFSDFERTRKNLFEEFQKLPNHHYCIEQEPPNEVEYQKILNSILYSKKRKNNVCLSSKRLQSAKSLSTIHSKRFLKLDSSEEKPRYDGFYITECQNMSRNRQYEEESFESKNQKVRDGMLDEEKQKLIWLAVEISEERQKSKNYQEEINQLEISMRYIRKQNISLEDQLGKSEKKGKKVFKDLLQQKCALSCVSSRNKYISQNYESTSRQFKKELKNIQISKNCSMRRTQMVVDEVIQAILIRNNYRGRIEKQVEEIKELKHKEKVNGNKLLQFDELFKKSVYFITISHIITFIKENSYGKITKVKHILEGCNSAQEGCEEELKQFQYSKESRDVIRVFRKMKHDAAKIEKIYKMKIDQFEELFQTLKEVKGKLGECPEDQSIDEIHWEEDLRQEITRKKNTLNKMCYNLVSIEERCQFILKKQILFMQKIIQNWLKFDQSAINFISSIMDSYISTVDQKNDIITFQRVKDMLTHCFENWSKYENYIGEIEENSILNRLLKKNTMQIFFRRIIKTKLKNPDISTELLFQKFLSKHFKERIQSCQETTLKLLKTRMKIYKYCSKYQILIVNSVVKNEPEVKKITDSPRDRDHFNLTGSSQHQSKNLKNEKNMPKKKILEEEMVGFYLEYQKEISKISSSRVSLRNSRT